MTPVQSRYPGARSFGDDAISRKVFFGRDNEAESLFNRIMVNRLVVVFARSGLGKTSLLNAGVAERLREEHHIPLMVRVNNTENGPLTSVYAGIEECAKHQQIECIPGERTTLWHYFKTVQFWRDDILQTPVLILDQFEELFSLQSGEQRRAFIEELSFLIRGVRPTPTKDFDNTDKMPEKQPHYGLSDAPPTIRVVISLREDFVGHLEDMADSIPQILDHRFRLHPLTRQAANEAMIRPADLKDDAFPTARFTIHEDLVKKVMDYLSYKTTPIETKEEAYIEPFQLQLICQHIESRVKVREANNETNITITEEDIGGEKAMFELLNHFYRDQWQALPRGRLRRAVRQLCEEHLVSPTGRRLSIDEKEIERLLKISPSVLAGLVEARLLRSDRRANSTYYEISHDALVAPIIAESKFYNLMRGKLLTIAAVALFVFIGLTVIGTVIELFSPGTSFSTALFTIIVVVVFALAFFIKGLKLLRSAKEISDRAKIR